jgi:hypothetical protein
MSAAGQMICPICGEHFQMDDIVLTYRIWPGHEQVGHADCIVSLCVESQSEEDEEDS